MIGGPDYPDHIYRSPRRIFDAGSLPRTRKLAHTEKTEVEFSINLYFCKFDFHAPYMRFLLEGQLGINCDLRGLQLFFFQKGTPWECGFSLHSATTDTAHLCSHCICDDSLTALQPLTISD